MALDETLYGEGDTPELSSGEPMSVSEAHCKGREDGYLPTGYYELPSSYDTWCSPPVPGWKTDWDQALYLEKQGLAWYLTKYDAYPTCESDPASFARGPGGREPRIEDGNGGLSKYGRAVQCYDEYKKRGWDVKSKHPWRDKPAPTPSGAARATPAHLGTGIPTAGGVRIVPPGMGAPKGVLGALGAGGAGGAPGAGGGDAGGDAGKQNGCCCCRCSCEEKKASPAAVKSTNISAPKVTYTPDGSAGRLPPAKSLSPSFLQDAGTAAAVALRQLQQPASGVSQSQEPEQPAEGCCSCCCGSEEEGAATGLEEPESDAPEESPEPTPADDTAPLPPGHGTPPEGPTGESPGNSANAPTPDGHKTVPVEDLGKSEEWNGWKFEPGPIDENDPGFAGEGDPDCDDLKKLLADPEWKAKRDALLKEALKLKQDALDSLGGGKVNAETMDPELRNFYITSMYKDLAKSGQDNELIWANLAALASRQVGDALQNLSKFINVLNSGGAAAAEARLVFSITKKDAACMKAALEDTNLKVFDDLYWQHKLLADPTGKGLQFLLDLCKYCLLSRDVCAGWRMFEKSRKMRAAGDVANADAFMWEASKAVIYHEQKNMIQKYGFDKCGNAWELVESSMPAPFAGARSWSDWREDNNSSWEYGPFGIEKITNYGDIGKFDDRWDWTVNELLAKWKDVHGKKAGNKAVDAAVDDYPEFGQSSIKLHGNR